MGKPMFEHYISQISIITQKSRNPRQKYEMYRENKKTHTFFLKIEVEMMNNNGGFCEKHGGFERGINGKDNE